MSNQLQQVSFMQACREFFGLKENQRPLDFGKEVHQLTQTDRDEIAAGLIANGFNIKKDTIAISAKAA